jgi:TetR/AcrR family transcriptional repressor of nem operon
MPRRKAFEPDAALGEAIACFRRLGFAAASMDDLTQAMGIGRQSLYATYGDKRALFLQALSWYADGMVARFVTWLDGDRAPLETIAEVLHEIARFAASPEGVDGCFITNSAADLAARDADVRAILVRTYGRIEDAFARALRRARDAGDLPADRDPRALARFIVTFIQGMRVIGTTRPSPKRLHADVEAALRCLAPPRRIP